LWEKLALNDARMMKIAIGGKKFVFEKFRKLRENVVVLLLNDLNHAA